MTSTLDLGHEGAQEVLAAPPCGRLAPVRVPDGVDAGDRGGPVYLYSVLNEDVCSVEPICVVCRL